MKAYRIQNDIVAARDAQEAIAAWRGHYEEKLKAPGPVEEIDAGAVEVSIEDEHGEWKTGKVADVMPTDGPAEVIAFGECENCG